MYLFQIQRRSKEKSCPDDACPCCCLLHQQPSCSCPQYHQVRHPCILIFNQASQKIEILFIYHCILCQLFMCYHIFFHHFSHLNLEYIPSSYQPAVNQFLTHSMVVAHTMCYINSAINPYIYYTMSQAFNNQVNNGMIYVTQLNIHIYLIASFNFTFLVYNHISPSKVLLAYHFYLCSTEW
jgi:hypothetical protein